MEQVVVISGAGNLGRRHLDALLKVPQRLAIYIIDPDAKALSLAKKVVEKIDPKSKHRTILISAAASVPTEVFLYISATNSNSRLGALKSILANKRKIRFAILEKVLFGRIDHLEIAEKMLARASVKAWVNCPRRTLHVYQNLRAEVSNITPLLVTVRGNDWGLFSNGIHFLDVFEFISRQKVTEIDCSKVNPNYYNSKRDGFWEFKGEMRGITMDGEIVLISDDESSGLTVTVETANKEFIINETEKKSFLGKKQV